MQVQEDVLHDLLAAADLAAVSVAAMTEERLDPFLLGMTSELEPVQVMLDDPNDVTTVVAQVRQQFGRLIAAVFVTECSTLNTHSDPWVAQDAIVISGIAVGEPLVGSVYVVDRSAPRLTRERICPGYVEGLDQFAGWMTDLISPEEIGTLSA